MTRPDDIVRRAHRIDLLLVSVAWLALGAVAWLFLVNTPAAARPLARPEVVGTSPAVFKHRPPALPRPAIRNTPVSRPVRHAQPRQPAPTYTRPSRPIVAAQRPTAPRPVVPAPRPVVVIRPAPAPRPAVTPNYCAIALAYLAAHAHPGFGLYCDPVGDLNGTAATTWISYNTRTGATVGGHIVIYAPSCAVAYENEASNSWFADSNRTSTLRGEHDRTGRVWDPFGLCPGGLRY